MEDDSDYPSFVKVAEKESCSEDYMELPREKDGTVLLSTIQAQFTHAIGLKYKSSSGAWRGKVSSYVLISFFICQKRLEYQSCLGNYNTQVMLTSYVEL